VVLRCRSTDPCGWREGEPRVSAPRPQRRRPGGSRSLGAGAPLGPRRLARHPGGRSRWGAGDGAEGEERPRARCTRAVTPRAPAPSRRSGGCGAPTRAMYARGDAPFSRPVAAGLRALPRACHRCPRVPVRERPALALGPGAGRCGAAGVRRPRAGAGANPSPSARPPRASAAPLRRPARPAARVSPRCPGPRRSGGCGAPTRAMYARGGAPCSRRRDARVRDGAEGEERPRARCTRAVTPRAPAPSRRSGGCGAPTRAMYARGDAPFSRPVAAGLRALPRACHRCPRVPVRERPALALGPGAGRCGAAGVRRPRAGAGANPSPSARPPRASAAPLRRPARPAARVSPRCPGPRRSGGCGAPTRAMYARGGAPCSRRRDARVRDGAEGEERPRARCTRAVTPRAPAPSQPAAPVGARARRARAHA